MRCSAKTKKFAASRVWKHQDLEDHRPHTTTMRMMTVTTSLYRSPEICTNCTWNKGRVMKENKTGASKGREKKRVAFLPKKI